MGLKNLISNIKANIRYNKGKACLNKGDLDEALEIFSTIKESDRAYAYALIGKAIIYKKKGNVEKALAILVEVPENSRMYGRSITDRINILNEENRVEEALNLYDIIPQASENYFYYVFEKARKLNDLERYQEGIDFLSKALTEKHNEEYLDGLRFISGYYGRLGEKQKSEEYRLKANELSQLWFSQGRISNMITTGPSSSKNEILVKADDAFRKGNYKDAIVYFKQYSEIETPTANTFNNWGLALLRYGWDIEKNEKRKCLLEAIEIGNKAIELEPEEGLYHANLGLYISQLGVLDNNLEDRKVDMIPILIRGEELKQGVSAYTLACIYSLTNDIENAFKWFEVMLEHNPLDRSFIESDDDFENMRKDSRFEQLFDKYFSK